MAAMTGADLSEPVDYYYEHLQSFGATRSTSVIDTEPAYRIHSKIFGNLLWGSASIVGIPGNVLVLLVILRFRDMHSVANIFIFNLALAGQLFPTFDLSIICCTYRSPVFVRHSDCHYPIDARRMDIWRSNVQSISIGQRCQPICERMFYRCTKFRSISRRMSRNSIESMAHSAICNCIIGRRLVDGHCRNDSVAQVCQSHSHPV